MNVKVIPISQLEDYADYHKQTARLQTLLQVELEESKIRLARLEKIHDICKRLAKLKQKLKLPIPTSDEAVLKKMQQHSGWRDC